jgi:hypothetical protein
MDAISLLWTIVSIIVSVLASVAGAAWWLKSQLTGAELAGLRAENAALTAWRQYAEAQKEEITKQMDSARQRLQPCRRR